MIIAAKMQFLDPDQTHDILYADKIPSGILYRLRNAIGGRGIFDIPFPIIFVDREAPGGLYPWAENWSWRMFQFLKKLSQTHILDDGYLNGATYGFNPPYQANLPDSIDLSDYKLDVLSFKVPPQTEGVLTWLEHSHEWLSAPYCATLANRITCTMRRSRKFKNDSDLPQFFTVNTQDWLHNSVCFEGINLIDIEGKRAKFLLYDEMEDFLDYLWNTLDIPDTPLILKGLTVTRDVVISEGGISNAPNATPSNPVFVNCPSWYFFAGLILADGAKYGSEFQARKVWVYELQKSGLYGWSEKLQIGFYLYEDNPFQNPTLGSLFNPIRVALYEESTEYWFNPSTGEDYLGAWLFYANPRRANNDYTKTGHHYSYRYSNPLNLWYIVEWHEDFSIYQNTSPLLTESGNVFLTKIVHQSALPTKTAWTVISQSGKASTTFLENKLIYEYEAGGISVIESGVVDLPGNGAPTPLVEFSVSFNLSLNFRLSPPEIVNLSDSEIEEILFPNGPDGPPFLDPDPDNGDVMPDSKRVKETHFYIEDVHRFLGCSALPDGNWREFPQPRPFSGPEGIPEGWQFYTANKDGAGIYQKRSRILAQDAFGRPLVMQGGYVQCHNLMQRLECVMDDLTYQLGGDEATGFMIPTADGKFIPCTSMFNAVAQTAYTVSQVAYGVNQIKTQCRQLLSICTDTLRGLGIPLGKKVINIKTSNGSGQTWVPAIMGKGPTISSQIAVVLANLGMVVASGMKVVKLDKD